MNMLLDTVLYDKQINVLDFENKIERERKGFDKWINVIFDGGLINKWIEFDAGKARGSSFT